MKMRRLLLAFMIALVAFMGILGLFSGRKVSAEGGAADLGYDTIIDQLVIFPDQRIQEAKRLGYDVHYSKYKPGQYTLELYVDQKYNWRIDTILANPGPILINELNNFLWRMLLVWNFVVITAVENGFSLDLVDRFAGVVEGAIKMMVGFNSNGIGSTGLWGNFLTLIIILTGAWIAYTGLIKRKTTDAWSGLLSSLIILILSLAFFANSGGVMRYLNDISSGISQEIMGVGVDLQSGISNSSNDKLDQINNAQGNILLSDQRQKEYSAKVASFMVADQLYNMLIYEPYLMLQYGKNSSDPTLTQERINKILSNKTGSTARMNAVAEEKNGIKGVFEPNPMVTEAGGFQRLTLLSILIVFHLVIGLMFFFIAGAMLIYQFWFLIYALFAPFALLMALFPSYFNVAGMWFKNFVSYQIRKLVLGLFLSIVLTFSRFLYQVAPPKDVGYVWTIALQLVMVVGIFFQRKELINVIQAPLRYKENKNIGEDHEVLIFVNYGKRGLSSARNLGSRGKAWIQRRFR